MVIALIVCSTLIIMQLLFQRHQAQERTAKTFEELEAEFTKRFEDIAKLVALERDAYVARAEKDLKDVEGLKAQLDAIKLRLGFAGTTVGFTRGTA